MGKFDGVLLATDYDDTLMPFGCHALSAGNLQAINYFCSEGGRFTLSTGRDLRSYQSIRPIVPVNAPVVLSNGAVIFDAQQENILYQCELPLDFRADLAKLMTCFPEIGIEVHRDDCIYVVRHNAGVQAHLDNIAAAVVPAELDTLPPVCTKIALIAPICFEETPLSRAIAAYCAATWPQKYEAALSHGILDLSPAGVHKGSGVLQLCELLQLSPSQLYCIGDNWNDLPMLRCCAQGFVPASARPELLQAPNLSVVPACSADAVAAVIAWLDRRF